MANAVDIVVIGAMNSDFLMKGECFPRPGETVEGTEFLSAAGGKGANQAVAAARLGARVALISCVGADARGKGLLREVGLEGVDVGHVATSRKAATGAALVMIDESGEKSILAFPGANGEISTNQIREAKRLITSAKVLLFQFEAPMKTLLVAAQMAHAAGVKVVLDPAPAHQPSMKLLRLVDAIRPNSHEAEMLTDIRIRDRKSACKAGRKLQRLGIQIVAIQAGEEGNLLLWEEDEVWLPKLAVKTVDATGAGDAFAAALAVALVEGQPARQAGAFCNAAAALTTTRLGAQPALPTRQQVDQMMHQGKRKL